MNNLTKEQLLNIIAAADEVLTALAGTNEDLHRDDSAKMCAAWDYLNDNAAPPEVVKQLAQSALAALTAEPIALPRVQHPAQFDYADKVAEVLKSKGLKVAGYDDE